MIDFNVNDVFINDLEMNLHNIMLNKDNKEFDDYDNTLIERGIRRIVQKPVCKKVIFIRESNDKNVIVLPSNECMNSIVKVLFDFQRRYTIEEALSEFIVVINLDAHYGGIKELIAQIFHGIDVFSNAELLLHMKAAILDKFITNGTIGKDKVYEFFNDMNFNMTLVPILSPLINELYTIQKSLFNKNMLLNYLFDDDYKSDLLLVKTGYVSELPPDSDNKDDFIEKKNRFTLLFNNTIKCMVYYIKNRGFLMDQCKACKTSTNPVEREYGEHGYEILKKNYSEIFDRSKFAYNEDGEVLSESVKSFLELKRKGCSELEYNELLVEIEMLESEGDSTDKMYLVTRIQRDINAALRAKHKTRNNEDIDEYIARLKGLLTKVQNTRIKPQLAGYAVNLILPENDYEIRK